MRCDNDEREEGIIENMERREEKEGLQLPHEGRVWGSALKLINTRRIRTVAIVSIGDR